MNSNTWNADQYNRHGDFVSALALPVVDLLAPGSGERILDLGCGDGTLAVEIARSGAQVVAVDLSESMVAKTKEKGIEAYVMSATDLPFESEFDAIFSNAVLHWVKEPEVAIAKIHRALKPGGRLIAEFGGAGNIRHLTEAMQTVFDRHEAFGEFRNPWYFPEPEAYQALLEAGGFAVEAIELIPRPTKIDHIFNWLATFANGITDHLTADQQAQFREEIKIILEPKIHFEREGWVADYVRLRFRAAKV